MLLNLISNAIKYNRPGGSVLLEIVQNGEGLRSALGPLGGWLETGPEANSNAFLPTALLYLVQGIPIGLAFQAYPVLLRQGGAPLELIALVPLASLPWAFKFFWSPLVENRWSAAMGVCMRRPSWPLRACWQDGARSVRSLPTPGRSRARRCSCTWRH